MNPASDALPPIDLCQAHPPLAKLLQRAYSGEKAAAFAYIGHAKSLRDPAEKAAIREIEADEWEHRRHVLALLQHYRVPVSRGYELQFHLIGTVIAWACYVIGWFMPYYFAGRLESGNVCEYFVMMQAFHSLGITEHDALLYEMGMKEKAHEAYFLEKIANSPWLPLFSAVFRWGGGHSFNDVALEQALPVSESVHYCEHYPSSRHMRRYGHTTQKERPPTD